jgi:hypothetical protein
MIELFRFEMKYAVDKRPSFGERALTTNRHFYRGGDNAPSMRVSRGFPRILVLFSVEEPNDYENQGSKKKCSKNFDWVVHIYLAFLSKKMRGGAIEPFDFTW